jgi:hypothetical protein
MLLHELPTKIARHLRIIVTRTDIPVIPATIALHGLMKARARQTRWFPPQGYSSCKNRSSDWHPFGLLKHPSPTIDPVRRLLKKDTSTMTLPRNKMEHRWGERIRMDMPVHVSADEVAGILGCMRNLSLSGALLRIDANLRLNALIEVSVELPQPSHPPAILLAHVSRKWKEDIGIEWCEFAPIVVKDLLRSPSMRLPL